ncbi:MAG TPA: PilZ domain-containing protein [Candidatus Acidoferrum sp.]|nr:PilZ domain-containing protein [Candidatus Acidoferrum sp.]
MERFAEHVVKDRRLAERHSVRMPLQLRLRASDKREEKVETVNVSRRGVFFITELPLDKGTALDVLLEMPEDVSGVRPAQWICLGHVARVVPSFGAGGKRGVGVEFDFYVVSHTTAPRWEFGPGLRGPLRP